MYQVTSNSNSEPDTSDWMVRFAIDAGAGGTAANNRISVGNMYVFQQWNADNISNTSYNNLWFRLSYEGYYGWGVEWKHAVAERTPVAGEVVTLNANLHMEPSLDTIALTKALVAASTDFADFKTRVAAL